DGGPRAPPAGEARRRGSRRRAHRHGPRRRIPAEVRVRISLRWKLVAALVLTSAATLLGAIVAISPPLEDRIAQDQVHSLNALARTSRYALAGLSADDLKPRSKGLRRIAHGLEIRTGGRVAILDTSGRTLLDPAP